jgi:hypothetical protein
LTQIKFDILVTCILHAKGWIYYCIVLSLSQNIRKNGSTKVNVFGLNFAPNTLTYVDFFCLYFGIKEVLCSCGTKYLKNTYKLRVYSTTNAAEQYRWWRCSCENVFINLLND